MPAPERIQILVARQDGHQKALVISPLAFQVLVGLLEVSTDRLGMGSEPPWVSTDDWDKAEAAIPPLVAALKETLNAPELTPAEQAVVDDRRQMISNVVRDIIIEDDVKRDAPEVWANIVKATEPRAKASCTCGHKGTFASGEHGPSCALNAR